jgi:hypothetical protein
MLHEILAYRKKAMTTTKDNHDTWLSDLESKPGSRTESFSAVLNDKATVTNQWDSEGTCRGLL